MKQPLFYHSVKLLHNLTRNIHFEQFCNKMHFIQIQIILTVWKNCQITGHLTVKKVLNKNLKGFCLSFCQDCKISKSVSQTLLSISLFPSTVKALKWDHKNFTDQSRNEILQNIVFTWIPDEIFYMASEYLQY